MKAKTGKNHDTRERLLEAAGAVFARRGFRAATVREISQQACANVAAVNYHFGDKEQLYSAVLKYALDSAIKKYPPDLGVPENSPPEERLRAFVRSILLRILDEGRPAWHGRLMVREMARPTAALDQLIEEAIRPLHKRLASIIRELIGSDASDERVRLCTLSIIGQSVFYQYAQPVVSKLYEQKFAPADIERLAEHITQFSLGAIKAFEVSSGQ